MSVAGWRVLVACWVCQVGLGLGGYVFAVFLKPIVAELGWTRGAFAAAGGPLLLAMALASPGVGRVTDRVGPRLVFATSITLVAVALLGLSVMTTLWQFYALGFVLGVAITGLGDIPAGATVARWLPARRGLVLGLVYAGSNVGGAIVPLVATTVADLSSWRWALRVLAVGGWLVVFPFAAFGVPAGRGPAAADPTPDDGADGVSLAVARRTATFRILAAVLFAFYFYYLGVNNHLVAFLSDAGFADAAAARRFGAAVAVGIVGKVGMGLLADRIPARRASLVGFGLMTLGSFLLLAVPWVPGLLPWFLVVHGLTVAAENVLLPLVIAECFGTRHMAAIYGALMFALLPGGVAGPTIAGVSFDTTKSYLPAFGLFAAANVAAVAGLAQLRAVRR